MSSLLVRDLSLTYPGGVHALKGVSLTVLPGMFGLLGPNGAGKSSLMRILATLQDADSGSVHLGDLDVLADKEAVRRVLGYLPQAFGFDQRATAEDALDHLALLKGLGNRGERRETVGALLARVNLWEARDRKVGALSGGMKQRLGVAQALIGRPRLLIVDEPTAGLDPAERRRLHDLLSEVGEDVVVILSTHIVEDVRDLCTAFAVIQRGEILLTGDPREAVAALEGQVWRATVDKGQVPTLRDRYDVISTRLYAGQTVVHVSADAPPTFAFEPVAPTLEDVYFRTLQATEEVHA